MAIACQTGTSFLADDWKVCPRLTLNVGMRYEVFGFPYEVNGLLVTYDYPAALATGLCAGWVYVCIQL